MDARSGCPAAARSIIGTQAMTIIGVNANRNHIGAVAPPEETVTRVLTQAAGDRHRCALRHRRISIIDFVGTVSNRPGIWRCELVDASDGSDVMEGAKITSRRPVVPDADHSVGEGLVERLPRRPAALPEDANIVTIVPWSSEP